MLDKKLTDVEEWPVIDTYEPSFDFEQETSNSQPLHLNDELPSTDTRAPKQQASPEQTDESLTTDIIGFFHSNLSANKLLAPEQEEKLGQDLDKYCENTVLCIMEHKSTARDFATILNFASKHAVKVNMFQQKQRYYLLRQELDGFSNDAHNQAQLSKLLSLAKKIQKSLTAEDALHKKISIAIASVKWSRPLIMAIAKRYQCNAGNETALEHALGEYLSAIKYHSQTNPQELSTGHQDQQLRTLIASYLRTRDTLVEKNLPLVLSIAKKYASDREDLMELVQEGTLGLIRATEKYRISTGNRFSTYAYNWIESKVRLAKVNTNNIIAISPEINRELGKLQASKENLRHAGKDLSKDSLAKDLKLKSSRISLLESINRDCLSMDDYQLNSGDSNLHNVIADRDTQVLKRIMDSDRKDKLQAFVRRHLTDRESYILLERYGCIDAVPKTIRILSDILNISRERVRQIEKKAIEKLQSILSDPRSEESDIGGLSVIDR
ncbi:MAG: RNA polymerase sigma factor (sigma-70 family) [Cellvibrionaceae bacterium]|jgi:RNA polymerase sigma factor (sigma-70 family)